MLTETTITKNIEKLQVNFVTELKTKLNYIKQHRSKYYLQSFGRLVHSQFSAVNIEHDELLELDVVFDYRLACKFQILFSLQSFDISIMFHDHLKFAKKTKS